MNLYLDVLVPQDKGKRFPRQLQPWVIALGQGFRLQEISSLWERAQSTNPDPHKYSNPELQDNKSAYDHLFLYNLYSTFLIILDPIGQIKKQAQQVMKVGPEAYVS